MSNFRRLMIMTLRFAARPLPAGMRDWARQVVETRLMSRFPDRAILLNALFPALHQTSALSNNSKVLWIGCRAYTKLYYDMIEQNGAECWSVDIDPEMQPFGRSGRHITGDMLELRQLFPGNYFDAVLCNGVFGYGVNTPTDQLKAFEAMATVMKPNGWLLIGWNTDRMSDPLKFGFAERWFEHVPLPGFAARYVVDGCTHVYDTYRRLNGASQRPTANSTTLADHMKEFVENGDK
jgi:SAM-dependent methyltransferase